MMKKLFFLPVAVFALTLIAGWGNTVAGQTASPQQLAFAGLRSVGHQGQFNAVAADSGGNLFLLLDQKDGVRVLKTDPAARTILAQALLGAAGDVGLAMALDPAGNVYVTGTTTSGSLTATTGAAFANPADSTVNAFVAKFDPTLNLVFTTFGGSGSTSASAIAATADAVFITGIIYGSGLPVTPSAIQQGPASGTTQNGFVEKFSANGSTLLYATYLTGQNGVTAATAIAADASDDAYIAGFTTATGFPTIAALVPRIQGATSGFLAELTPAGDGITFSTFIPGDGINSMAIDTVAGNLLLSGPVALGQFPIATAPMPLVPTTYQVLVRMSLDGSAVLASTVVAPGTQSSITPTASGSVWVDGTLSTPLLPVAPAAALGSGFAVRVSPATTPGQVVIDEAVRLGGLASPNNSYASLPVTLNALTVDASGSPVFAGIAAPTASSSQLATQTFDLPLTAATSALPSAVHDAVLDPASCTNSSLCSGGGAYLARVTPTAGASLTLSTDIAPGVLVRNLGSAAATNLQITPSGFTLAGSTCGSTLAAGDECTLVLAGGGPGSVTVQADNAAAQTAAMAATTATANTLIVSPKELDFGIQAAAGPTATRTLTVTNLGPESQTFTSIRYGSISFGHVSAAFSPYSEVSSDCPVAGLATSKQLAAGATCHIVIGFTASSDNSNDGASSAYWTVGPNNVALTGFAQAASLSVSAAEIDFGTQFAQGLRSARYLYLSNNSAVTVSHTAVALPAGSPFTVIDNCPAQLGGHTVCQIQLAYQAAQSTSTDATTLTLDQGLSVLVTGETIPQPGVSGTTANPNLTVTPSTIAFTSPVVVTGVSSSTQTVTIQNTGTSAFSLALVLTGDFTDQTNCTAFLAGGASCTAILSFAPSQPGARQGLLSVTAGSNTTPLYVSLSGTATPILPANNGTLDFGSVPIGQPSVQWYKVSQPFTTFTAATLNAQFKVLLVEDIGYGHGQPASSSFLSATTGSCVNCWLGIQFTPATAGPQSSGLSLASSTLGNPYNLNLTGSGAAPSGVQLASPTQDFGTVSVHSSSAPVLFTLTNLSLGGASINVNAPTFTGDFSLSTAVTGGTPCGGPLAANASCLVPVFFSPTATGQRTGSITLQTTNGTATASLTGFGSADPGVSFNPSALVFNNVPGPTATQQTITVANTGTGSITISPPANANSAFSSSTTCATLAPAGTCAITVVYAPAASTVTDTLQVPVTAIVGGSPVLTTYTLPLSATYTAQSAGLQIVPGTTNYGQSPVNALGSTRQFTLTNLTAKSLAIALTIPREFVLNSAPCAGLAPNASCTFSVSFLPITNGAITGTLFAQGTPTDGSATLDGLGFVQGYGTGTTALTISGNISPGRIVNFGTVPSGQSAQQVLTLTNTSSASATVTTVTVHRITSQWPFLSTSTCGATLAIGQSCTVTIRYTPLNQVASGTTAPPPTVDAGVLTVESDAVSAPDLIDLAGTASPATVTTPANTAPLVAFTASQSSLTFGSTPIGAVSAAQTVTLSNTGNALLHIASVTASADFSATSNCTALLPGASCTLTIAFTPQVSALGTGPRLGAVEIASDSSVSLEFLSLLGTASPSTLVFAPASLNFGIETVGQTLTLPVQVTNAGAVPATFTGITTTGDYAATGNCPAPGGQLAANASCTIQVAFKPTATGVRPGTLSVASSVSTTPLTVALTGTGVQSHLQINPASLSFGNVNVGASTSLTLTLVNTGTASTTGIAFATTGDYAVTAPCSFLILSPGASCSVTVAFSPTAAGVRPGTLTVTSSDPASPATVTLTGTGIGTGLAGVTFNLTVDGGAASTQTVQQTRPATYTLAVTPLNGFTGTVVLNCTAVTAAPNAACSIQPSSVALSGGTAQPATVTINTLTSARLVKPIVPSAHGFNRGTAFCILAPAFFFFWKFRKAIARSPISLFLAMLCTSLILLASGCGSGGDPNLRLTPSGTYQYTVTASATTGNSIPQTVTLNLIVQ